MQAFRTLHAHRCHGGRAASTAPPHAAGPRTPSPVITPLSRMLREQWDDGSLIYDLVVEGVEQVHVATERGTSRPALTEQLRDAIAQLALEYERAAYGERDQERVYAALARKRR